MNKIIKRIIKSLLIVIVLLLAIVGGYIVYMSVNYYRIEDNKDLTNNINNNQNGIVQVGNELSIMTYNIGFGAYTHEFSFFMDKGKMKTGEVVQGSDSRAKDKETVLINTNGSISTIKTKNPDFVFFQEVDIKATRSYNVNQYEMIQDEFNNMSSLYSSNFHSAYLFYPLTSPHGKVEAGIVTLSKYKITTATRRSLPIDDSFPTKFFDLDRSFTITRIPTSNNKELVLMNVHLSAYDEGGIIREAQFKLLNEVLEEEYAKGNYIIAGGDFNHDIASTINNGISIFPTEQYMPEWVFILNNSNLKEHFKFSSDNSVGTCRSTDIPYQKGINFTCVLDGFITSDNIIDIIVTNIDNDFMYSDHNPVYMNFKLAVGE